MSQNLSPEVGKREAQILKLRRYPWEDYDEEKYLINIPKDQSQFL